MTLSIATANEPTTAAGFNKRGLAYFGQRELHAALSDFRTATRYNPNYAEAWNNCGIVQQEHGDLEGALADFDRAVTLKETYADALNNRARARQALGDLAGARADFDQALLLGTGRFLATVFHNRASLRQFEGDLQGALADLDRALEVNPENPAAHASRAIVRRDAGDFDGALADFDFALEKTPRECAAPLYNGRGSVLVLRNDFVAALADYDEAIRIDPCYYIAYISRANAYYHRRQVRGLADYLTAFSLNPEGAAHELVRLLAEGIERDANEVLANCDQHLRINDRDLLAHGRRGLTLILLNREQEAGPNLAHFRALAPGCATHLERLIEFARGFGSGLVAKKRVPMTSQGTSVKDLVFSGLNEAEETNTLRHRW